MNSVFAVNIEDIIDNYHSIITSLDIEDREAVLKFKFEKDQCRKIASILLIKFIIRKKFSLTKYELAYNTYGKPYLKDHPDKNFNLSHSGSWVVGVISSKPVGIDIELVNNIDSFEDIAKRFFSVEEYRFLIKLSIEQKLSVFYEIWTKKESLIKAIGKGLSISLDSFTVPFKSIGKIYYEKANWNIFLLDFANAEYKLAIASKISPNEFSAIEYITFKELLKLK